jgi:cysteinyl-tRNA synthetase
MLEQNYNNTQTRRLMNLYNSLTKQTEDFTPLQNGVVKMYSCGPTVYDNLHIGNLSAFIYADLLRRTLTLSNYEVLSVMNITDVDDKTIRDSKRDYPHLEPMKALNKLTRKYEQVFLEDIARIGNDITSITFIRATDTIQEMISLTQTLLDSGLAYPANDGIYFSIKAYELAGFNYGKLQQIDRSHEYARISNDEYDKDSASDFALWKKAESGEPSWPATFTHDKAKFEMAGRPGWHIECSAMSQKLLGIPFDIHTGGIDLKFPHHENEIAQSCGANSRHDFAKYFVHNNHILIDGKKMSKSLNNFYTLREIEEKGFTPLAFRLFVIQSSYRTESNFTWEALEAAEQRLKHLQAFADLAWQSVKEAGKSEVSEAERTIIEAMEDDLNTPVALEAISKLINKFDNRTPNDTEAKDIKQLLKTMDAYFGLNLSGRPDITAEDLAIINERNQARADKDWKKSDELRDKLTAKNISINDTPGGSIWYQG